MKYVRKSRRGALRAELLAASYAVATRIYIDLVGRLMLAELLAVVGLIISKPLRMIRSIPRFKTVMFGYAFLLAGLIVSDVYNGTSLQDYLRGWAAIIFGVISTIFLTAQFMKSSRAILLYLAAAAIAAIFLSEGSLNMAIIEDNSNYFKIKFVPVLLPSLALVSCLVWRRSRLLSAGILFVGGIVFMLFDARSSGFGLILAALLLMVQIFKIRPRLSQVILSFLIISAIAYGGYVYYVSQVIYHGVGGKNAQQVLQADNPYNPFELLMIGRSENVVALAAIKDRPFFGYGSWALDKTGKYSAMLASLHGLEYYSHRLGIIPVHSMIGAAWLWGGVIGAGGMLMVGIGMVKAYLRSFWFPTQLSPLVNIYFVASAWAFFFSPLGHIRVSFPFVIALLVAASLLDRSRSFQ